MIDNLKALFFLYARPSSGFGRILDRGRLWFSALLAILVGFFLHFDDLPIRGFAPPLSRFISYAPGGWLYPLLILAIITVPAIILVRSIATRASFTFALSGDYIPLLMCSLMAWAAAYLPLAILRWFAFIIADNPLVYLIFNVYALILTAFAVRTIYGARFGFALATTAVAWIAGAAGSFVFGIVGGLLYFLASPLVLIYVWIIFGSNLRNLGATMRSRQHFQRQLEISTANPHDADAHYQLGLIYQKRRQLSEAAARFEQAVKIDPSMADAHYQLGLIARQQGRLDDAIAHLRTAAAADDRLAQHEVWRDLGATLFQAGRIEEANAALEKFVSRREYDPEGLYWFGMVLKQTGRADQARNLFQRSIEAARTMPAHRRSEVSVWARKSKSEL